MKKRWKVWGKQGNRYIALRTQTLCVIAQLFGEEKEKEENAALMAAAPELLEELESHCAICMWRHPECEKCDSCKTRKALKKARGEE